ncbi:MAG: mobilization protein, partial [Gammaproteobacteria bacterium]|nr:mobilization protein [Gammaproteobacteria bacterium]
ILVENFGRGSDFSDVEKSAPFQRARALGAQVIQLSKLHDAAIHKIDMTDASFWAATNNKELLSMPDRMRVKVWLNRAFDQLGKVLPQEIKTEQGVVEAG